MKLKRLIIIICVIFAINVTVSADIRIKNYDSNLEEENKSAYDMIHAYKAWDTFLEFADKKGLEPINIGLMDTSFYTAHKDLPFAEVRYSIDAETLRNKFVNNMDSLEEKATKEKGSLKLMYGHGTHVAGIMGSVFDNGIGINGMYPLASQNGLYAFSTIDYDESNGDWYVEGLKFLLENNVRVINISYTFDVNEEDKVARSAKIITGFLESQLAAGKDFIIITSAGNTGGLAEEVNPLARIDGVVGKHILVVANTKTSGRLEAQSSRGDRITISAPGNVIVSASPEGYVEMSGTSMSSPFVAGTAAMVWNILEPYQDKLELSGIGTLGSVVKNIIEDTAAVDEVYDTLLPIWIKDVYGKAPETFEDHMYPLLDSEAAVKRAIDLVTDNLSSLCSDVTKSYPVMPLHIIRGRPVVNSNGWKLWAPNWKPSDMNGLLTVDMQDYDGDGQDEFLAVLFNAEDNILHEQLLMFEYVDGKLQLKASHDIPVETNLFYDELYSGFRVSTFTVDNDAKKTIVLNYDNYREGGGSVLALYNYDGSQFVYEQGFMMAKGSDDTVWCSRTSSEPDMPLSWMDVSPWVNFAHTDDEIVYGGVYEYQGEEYCNHIRSIEQEYESAIAEYGIYWNRFNGTITDLKGIKAVNLLNIAPLNKLFTGIHPLCDVNLYVKYYEEEGDDEYPLALLITADYTQMLKEYREQPDYQTRNIPVSGLT